MCVYPSRALREMDDFESFLELCFISLTKGKNSFLLLCEETKDDKKTLLLLLLFYVWLNGKVLLSKCYVFETISLCGRLPFSQPILRELFKIQMNFLACDSYRYLEKDLLYFCNVYVYNQNDCTRILCPSCVCAVIKNHFIALHIPILLRTCMPLLYDFN